MKWDSGIYSYPPPQGARVGVLQFSDDYGEPTGTCTPNRCDPGFLDMIEQDLTDAKPAVEAALDQPQNKGLFIC